MATKYSRVLLTKLIHKDLLIAEKEALAITNGLADKVVFSVGLFGMNEPKIRVEVYQDKELKADTIQRDIDSGLDFVRWWVKNLA